MYLDHDRQIVWHGLPPHIQTFVQHKVVGLLSRIGHDLCKTVDRTAFPMIRLSVSQTPIGRTPGLLSSGTRRHANKAKVLLGSRNSVEILQAREARALQRFLDDFWKLVQRRFQAEASSPDGPAEPVDLSAIFLMRSPSITSKMMA